MLGLNQAKPSSHSKDCSFTKMKQSRRTQRQWSLVGDVAPSLKLGFGVLTCIFKMWPARAGFPGSPIKKIKGHNNWSHEQRHRDKKQSIKVPVTKNKVPDTFGGNASLDWIMLDYIIFYETGWDAAQNNENLFSSLSSSKWLTAETGGCCTMCCLFCVDRVLRLILASRTSLLCCRCDYGSTVQLLKRTHCVHALVWFQDFLFRAAWKWISGSVNCCLATLKAAHTHLQIITHWQTLWSWVGVNRLSQMAMRWIFF